MYLMIDNYDSFVHNLVGYFEEENIIMEIVRNDKITTSYIDELIDENKLEGIIISPGPKSPKDCGICREIVKRYYKDIPIFGVCLGHQIIGYVFGLKVSHGTTPMHGKVNKIINSQKNIFENLPREFNITRYHSLAVYGENDNFDIEAKTSDGVNMAMSHKKYPLYSVQFHPEAVLTEYGHDMIRNFIKKSREWNSKKINIKKLDTTKSIYEIFRILGSEDTVFLDSSLKNSYGQNSILALNPYLELKDIDNTLYINGVKSNESFEKYLDKYLKENSFPNITDLPIIGGAIGYFSYDYGRKFENIQTRHKKDFDIPDAIITFYNTFIMENRDGIFISYKNKSDYDKIIDNIKNKSYTQKIPTKNNNLSSFKSNFEKDEYKDTIQKMIDYIVDGDIYITNMTQSLTVKSNKNPLDVFDYLRYHNPAPFGAYLDYGDFKIVSASPERFIKIKNNEIETRPIKGTRKRGETEKEDEILKKELINSEKDKSELLMIVDLERNDLHRVSECGSVNVSELFKVETYATVFHLVSTIKSKLKKDFNMAQILPAMFPGGSITGAPKIRAMEIIDELENTRRNIYTGSIGYISLNGDVDFNIVIRTALYKDGKYSIGVGGGITCESDTEFEYQETLQKAKAILEALV